MIEILVITISKPLLIGVYKDKKLIKTYKDDGMTSDVLPIIFKEILANYKIESIYYVNTPGSYMAIKVAYIFLKSISIAKGIKLFACSGFLFNNNSPIKALRKKYFFNDDKTIKVDFLDKDTTISDFELPNVLENIEFSDETLLIYNLPAV